MQLTDNNGNIFGANGLEVTGPDGKPKTISGGGSPTGPAGGDLSGTYPNPSVVWNNGTSTYNSLYYPLSSNPAGYLTSAAAASIYQPILTLTTTGTSGPATLVGSTLNIPQYSGGGGGSQGIHIITKPLSGVYYNAQFIQSQSTIGVGSGILYLYPFIPINTLTINELNLEVTTAAAGNFVKVGIYSNVNGLPNTKLIESASFDMTTTGIKTFITSFTFNAGTTYWIGHIGNGFSGAIRSIGSFPVIAAVNGSTNFNAFAISTSFSSLPSTLTVSSGNLTGAAGLAKINFKQV